jgi:hypothetical protein
MSDVKSSPDQDSEECFVNPQVEAGAHTFQRPLSRNGNQKSLITQKPDATHLG